MQVRQLLRLPERKYTFFDSAAYKVDIESKKGYNKMTFSRGIPLSGYTTYRIGGAAEFFCDADCVDDLFCALQFSKDITVLGGGSNILVSDKGVKGLVVRMRCGEITVENGLVTAEAGAALAKLSAVYCAASLGGMEWAAMIPGSVGGACKMNAGAFDSSVAESVVWVEVLREGRIIRLTADECGFSYRRSGFLPADIIVRAAFRAASSDPVHIAALRAEFARRRQSSQPAGKSAGSVFKKDAETGIAAGWYIEKAGFKGLRVGGAVVSQMHANFILNTGRATAADVCELIAWVKAGVKEQFGIELKEEIERIGEF